MFDEAVMCVHCGTMQEEYYAKERQESQELLKSLSSRLKINGIIWLVVGILQALSGVFILTAIWNIVNAINDFNFSGKVLREPYNLVERYKPAGGAVLVLIWNIIFGGIVGIAGSIYYFIGIRGFVLENQDYFNSLNEEY